MKATYEITINVNIMFDYYPLKKSCSSDYEAYITHDEIESYDDWEDIELSITPKMLLEAISFVYGDSKLQDKGDMLLQTKAMLKCLKQAPYFFKKICAEVFDDTNTDYYSKYYDYLITTDECKAKIQEVINREVRSLGELVE